MYEPLFSRLRATPNVVPVLQAAATIGRHVDRALLGAVLTLDETVIDDVLDELEDSLVLEPWATDGWRFRHELLREVAYELAPPSVARGLHARVADAMLNGGRGSDPDWRMVAVHNERAERFDEAASAYQLAATEARRRGALAEARGVVDAAIAGLKNCPSGPRRDHREIALRLERGFLAVSAEGGTSPGSAADFERCLQLGGTDLRDDELIATLTALGAYYTRACRYTSSGPTGRIAARGPAGGAAMVPPGARDGFRDDRVADRRHRFRPLPSVRPEGTGGFSRRGNRGR